ncbi:MAG: hypothetical protein ACRCZ9_08270 [Fusobacteriaceae bacterium]
MKNLEQNIFKIMSVSDLHISTINPFEYYSNELVDIILFIQDNRHELDMIVFNGDLLHDRYRADSPQIQVFMDFMSSVLKATEGTNIQIHVVQGTKSHDHGQLKLLVPLRGFFNRLFIHETPGVFQLHPNLVCRFIPESYIDNYEEFADVVFSVPSHLTFFHGLVEGALRIAEKQTDIMTIKNAAILKVDDLLSSTTIASIGGHIHTRTHVRPNIWYTGSYSSHTFADTDNKGFDIIEVDTVQNKFSCQFVKNENCRQYKIINMTDEFKTLNIENLKNRFNVMKRNAKYNEITRIDIDTSMMIFGMIDNINICKTLYSDVFIFKVERQTATLTDSALREIREQADFVISKSIPIEDKIYKVLKDEYKYIMNKSRICDILDKPNVTL